MPRPRLPAALAAALFLSLAACDSGPMAIELDCRGGSPITIGDTVQGTLQEGDDLDVDGAFRHRYALTHEEFGTVVITMRSTELDAFLWLLTPRENLLRSDNDSGGGENGTDAQIVQSLAQGCYLIDATTLPGETGSYTLTVERPGGSPPEPS